MGRPWEYPRWRRVTMQLTLWVILAASLGLAQMITSQRRGVPVALQAPEQVGPVMVGFPENWVISQETPPEVGMLVAEDPAGSRAMTISVEEASAPVAGSQPIEFKGLHQSGTLTVLKRVRRSMDGLGYGGPEYELMATTPLRSGGALTIRLLTQRRSSEDNRLIQAVADGITSAAGKPRRVLPPVVPIHPDDFD